MNSISNMLEEMKTSVASNSNEINERISKINMVFEQYLLSNLDEDESGEYLFEQESFSLSLKDELSK